MTHQLGTAEDRQIRMDKEGEQARDTHFLKSKEGGVTQDRKEGWESKGCSLPGKCREQATSEWWG